MADDPSTGPVSPGRQVSGSFASQRIASGPEITGVSGARRMILVLLFSKALVWLLIWISWMAGLFQVLTG